MSVKSIQVKLVMPGDSEGEGIRRAFAQTHLVHNAGVHYFMENLLLMRQGDVYETRDSLKPDKTDSQYRKELLRFAYEARRRNGVSKKISDDEILALIRKVYEQIVPASIGESGDNQSIARDWLNSLVSKKSIAGLGKSKSGRKSTWTKLPDSDPRKAELKQRAEERKSEQKAAELRPRLKEFGLIPLWPMFRLQSGYQWAGVETKGKISAWDDDEVTAWERDMFQQALERISGWESWNKRAINRHQKAQEDLKDWEHEHAADFKIWRPIFERYEKNRKQEYEISPLGLKRPFRIGRRMLRGWDRIREKWLAAAKKNSSIPESELVDIAKKWQQAHPREIGDINFISYLAKPENRAVWSGEWDYAAFQAKHNALLFELEDSHPWTIMTLPNPLLHPLWPRLDVPKGTNMNDYGIVRDENGRWRLTLSILFPNSKLLAEKRITLPVAHSGQLDLLRPIEGSPRELVLRDQGTDEEFKGKWGGAGIRLDRDLLGKMKDEKTLRSYSGPVYINLTVDLTDNAAPSTKGFKKTPRAVAGEQFLIGIKEDAKSGEIRELKGLGCLSVDLGLRQVAACSVFRMKPTPPKGKFCFPIAGFDDLFMAHERSFLLSLPGEQADSAIESQRGKLRDELNKLSAGLAQLNKLIRLSGQEGDGRSEELKTLLEAEESLFDLSALESAKAKTELAPAAWRIEVERIHRSWERKFAQTLENWRKAGARSQQGKSSQYGVWGISLNGIDYLERTRKLLIRWTTHPRKAEETNRLAKNKLFAARLQKHIDALKEDRIKKAADAIVMAALGYVYAEDGKRTQKYKPCSIILLEDLDRYRFRTDRPRFENSKLMQWAHRAIFHEIARQAGLFGIVVGKVGAGFTSRFHAGTGTPGCRCAVVTQDMLRKPWFLKRLEEDGLKPAEVKAGQIIQMEGGKLFCSIESDKPVLIQADINAAQNLQKRFWTNYAEPFRAVCTIGQAPGSFIPLLQKRTEKFFSGKMLAAVNTDEPFICELVPSKGAVRKKPAAEQNSVTLDDGRILLHDEDEAAATKKTIFFRDPSGALLPKTRWYESKIFWSQVKQRVRKGLTIASDRKRCYT